MQKVLIKPVWVLRDHADGDELMPRVIPLLAAIHHHGSLIAACEETGHSYRHGWGLLQRARQAFGAPRVSALAQCIEYQVTEMAELLPLFPQLDDAVTAANAVFTVRQQALARHTKAS